MNKHSQSKTRTNSGKSGAQANDPPPRGRRLMKQFIENCKKNPLLALSGWKLNELNNKIAAGQDGSEDGPAIPEWSECPDRFLIYALKQQKVIEQLTKQNEELKQQLKIKNECR